MPHPSEKFKDYYSHLKQISLVGRMYKRYWTSPMLYWCASRIGRRIVEVGSGTGSGILGAYPKQVHGLDINPHSVAYCCASGLKAQLIAADGTFPLEDASFDVCVLDNVMEHIENPLRTLDECHRVTSAHGGLVIAVPGVRGYASDADHKKFYSEQELLQLDARWQMTGLFSAPLFFRSERLSRSLKQYCLVATYQKSPAIG